MTYELFTLVLQFIHIVLLVTATILSMFTVRTFYRARHTTAIMLVKKKVFTLMSVALVAMLAAFLVNYLYRFPGGTRVISAYDFFITISYILFIAALAYFWYGATKLHKLHVKEPIFMFGVACAVFIFNYYLYVTALIPASSGKSSIMATMMLTYPVLVSLMFLLTLIIHPVHRAGIIRTPLWYISTAVFTYFIGSMMYEYFMWVIAREILPAFFSAFFVLSASTFCIGMKAALKKYKT